MTKGNIKKKAALLLCASMLSGLSLSAVSSIKVHAATTSVLSVTAYADKDTLADDTFAPKYKGDGSFDEENGKIGKIKFGKDEDGNVQEWYILGKDDGVDGENTAIFADSNITKEDIEYNYAFCGQNPPYVGGRDVTKLATYDDADKPTAGVWWNHYAVSDVKDKLCSIATDTGYFSKAEQALMNETTVKTEDFKTQDGKWLRYYTTSDKLYAPGGDPNRNDPYNIYVGSKNSKLVMWAYWNSGNSFWLRSPDYYGNYISTSNLYAPPNSTVYYKRTNEYSGVRPASNLNLSNVLFASAAETPASTETEAKGVITDGTAMTLRLDGSKLEIGGVAYSSDTITVEKTTNSNAILVVQGKDTTSTPATDWYYSKLITSNDLQNITAEEIKYFLHDAVTGSINVSSVDLSSCKIWLEVSANDESTLSYAVTSDMGLPHHHVYSDYKSDADYHWKECTIATCPDAGTDKVKEETKAAHDYGKDSEWSHDSEYHYKKCITCGYIEDKEEHTFDENGDCKCGYNINTDHHFEHVDATASNCIKEGRKEYWKCTDKGCDVKYQTSLGVLIFFTDLSELDIEIDPNNHVLERTYEQNDSATHWVLCAGCKETLDKEEHTFEDNICTVCGYKKPDEGGDDKGDDDKDHDDKPDDGGTTSRTDSSSSSSSSSSTGWTKDSRGWKFIDPYGIYAKGSIITDANGNKVEKILWEKVGDKYFAIGSDGYLKTGWIYDRIENKWSYCDENNGRLSGWFYEPKDGYWYYLSQSTGEVLTGWQNINGKDYYFAATSSEPTYSYDAETDTWVYSNTNGVRPFGAMYANAVTPDNYQVDANGAWIH